MDFKDKLAALIAQELALERAVVLDLLVVPPQGFGDYAFPCFVAAKEQKKNPVAVAGELAKRIKAPFLEKAEAKGPYVNFFLGKETLAESVLESIFSGSIFENKLGSGKVMVEYSSPNTNKPLHLGHLRNNALGLAYSNLLEFVGYKVIKANLVNDRGIHICKGIVAYEMFAKNRDPKKEGIKPDHFVGDLYVQFSKAAEKDPSLNEKAQKLLLLWEKGDKKTVALWEKLNAWAIGGMKETYRTFGSEFDEWFFESDMFRKNLGTEILQEGLKKGLFKKEDNGAIVAILEPGLPNKVLLRGDGTSLYATNDLGVTQEKFEKFKLKKAVWVVGSEQDLYFKQLFAIFDKLGRPWAENCLHLSYGMVNLTTGKMKSREGTVVDADDIIAEERKLALDEVNKRYPDLSAKKRDERSMAIALAAIKFYLLKNDAHNEMLFDPKQSISFDGETGPYLQYTFARAKSILRKAESENVSAKDILKADFSALQHQKEKELIVELGKYPDVVKRSSQMLSLHPICHHLLSMAEKFNSFYHEVPVIKAESKKQMLARLALVDATTMVLESGLKLLDILALEEM